MEDKIDKKRILTGFFVFSQLLDKYFYVSIINIVNLTVLSA